MAIEVMAELFNQVQVKAGLLALECADRNKTPEDMNPMIHACIIEAEALEQINTIVDMTDVSYQLVTDVMIERMDDEIKALREEEK